LCLRRDVRDEVAAMTAERVVVVGGNFAGLTYVRLH